MRQKLAFLAYFILAISAPSFACSCGGFQHGKNRWEIARLSVESGATIFEGRVTAVHLHMKVLEAKEGEWIPASFGPVHNVGPYTSATIEVTKNYRGTTPKEVEVRSGLGGGDCGFEFEVGEEYLVFAGGSGSELGTSICSSTARIRDRTTELRYLRGERPTPEDLELFWLYRKSPPPTKAVTVRRPTGRICGEIDGLQANERATVAFQHAATSLPYPREWGAYIEGSHFCSELPPGNYIAYFQKSLPDEHAATFAYFPGVTSRAKAEVIEVRDGETTQIHFGVLWLRTQPVSVYVALSGDKLSRGIPERNEVMLIGIDGKRFQEWYREEITPNPWLNWTHLYRVTFPEVLPGRYVVFVTGNGNWVMQKRTVSVADRSQTLLVRLKRTK